MTLAHKTSYFGYGSNLWLHQMSLRCPSSTYIGVARLQNYRWIINSRGYANIIASSTPTDEVYGFVYTLTSTDEDRLDINEGVPYAYTKEILKAEFWSLDSLLSDLPQGGNEVDLLVYIDRNRTEADKPKQEYIYRMNMGIADALSKGVPKDYIDQVLRKFIPEEAASGTQELAHKQALQFEDEASDEERV